MDLARELERDFVLPTSAYTTIAQCQQDYLVGRVLPAKDRLTGLCDVLDKAIEVRGVTPDDAQAIIAVADSLLRAKRTFV